MDTRTGEIFHPDEPMPDEKRLRMEQAIARDELVPVSDRVAGLMLDAQRAERKRVRKAAKQARKKNR